MILEERDYRMKPGRMAEFLAIYECFGLPVQRRHLGELVGFFTTEVGELNRVVAMWRYDSLAERTERRARMLADPEWPVYLAKIPDLIDVQSNRFLAPVSFSPLR